MWRMGREVRTCRPGPQINPGVFEQRSNPLNAVTSRSRDVADALTRLVEHPGELRELIREVTVDPLMRSENRSLLRLPGTFDLSSAVPTLLTTTRCDLVRSLITEHGPSGLGTPGEHLQVRAGRARLDEGVELGSAVNLADI